MFMSRICLRSKRLDLDAAGRELRCALRETLRRELVRRRVREVARVIRPRQPHARLVSAASVAPLSPPTMTRRSNSFLPSICFERHLRVSYVPKTSPSAAARACSAALDRERVVHDVGERAADPSRLPRRACDCRADRVGVGAPAEPCDRVRAARRYPSTVTRRTRARLAARDQFPDALAQRRPADRRLPRPGRPRRPRRDRLSPELRLASRRKAIASVELCAQASTRGPCRRWRPATWGRTSRTAHCPPCCRSSRTAFRFRTRSPRY